MPGGGVDDIVEHLQRTTAMPIEERRKARSELGQGREGADVLAVFTPGANVTA